ncbi:MAG TPA: hypothetical protein DDW81_15700 [Cryomorphaceae bacterium]|nr:hypothetical protein [Cryomorphaceae bacterium]
MPFVIRYVFGTQALHITFSCQQVLKAFIIISSPALYVAEVMPGHGLWNFQTVLVSGFHGLLKVNFGSRKPPGHPGLIVDSLKAQCSNFHMWLR